MSEPQSVDAPLVPEPVLAEPKATGYAFSELQDRQLSDLMRTSASLFRNHPSLVLSSLYLLASALGLLFTVALLSEFQFNVLPYLEITDFLLAAVAYPETILVLLLAFAALYIVFSIDRVCRQRFPRYARAAEWSFAKTTAIPPKVALGICLVAYVYMAGTTRAPAVAEGIKQHKSAEFSLSLIYPMNPGGKETRMLQPVQLISRTSGYLVLYYEKQVMLIPHANVAAFVPLEKSVTAPAGKPAENPPSQSKAATPAAPIKEPKKAA